MNKKYLFLLFAISACNLAPKFVTPPINVPGSFKEDIKNNTTYIDNKIMWQEAVSLQASDRGKWWKIFGDKELDKLVDEALISNQSLKAAEARVAESRNIAKANRAGFFPSIDLAGNAVRAKSSNSSLAAFGNNSTANLPPYTLYSSQGVISYEADLFGNVRNNYNAANLDAQARLALYHSLMLALQADIAQNYFSLRTLDSEIKLLKETVKIRQEAYRIMQKRMKEGEASEQDKLRTESELASVEVDLIALKRQRASLEHSLAVLLGKAPADFTFNQMPLEKIIPPQIPASLPSSLLLRRPDIDAALNTVKSANAKIGVARSAFFPSLTLSASGGYSAVAFSDLFNWSGHSWALGQVAGNAFSLPIFHGGRNKANLAASKAAYEESVADYRQQVLMAFRDVEDNLINQQLLTEQSIKQNAAAKAASKTTDFSQKRYHEGEADYFEVVDSQRISLAAERAATQICGQRFLTAIALIRALGGGWE